jgi:hypothetical protein
MLRTVLLLGGAALLRTARNILDVIVIKNAI